MFYLLDLNKKQQGVYDSIDQIIKTLDETINKLSGYMELEFNDGFIEAIQPMTDILMRVGGYIVIFTWIIHVLDTLLKKGCDITLFDGISLLAKLFIGHAALGLAQPICLAFLNIFNYIMHGFALTTNSITIGEAFMNMEEVGKTLEDMGGWDLKWIKMTVWLFNILLNACVSIIKLIAEYRKLLIASFLIWSPLAFSSCATGFSGMGEFLKGFLSTGLQGAWTVGCLKLYEIVIAQEIFLDGIDGAFCSITAYTFFLVFLVLGGKGFLEKYILSKIFG